MISKHTKTARKNMHHNNFRWATVALAFFFVGPAARRLSSAFRVVIPTSTMRLPALPPLASFPSSSRRGGDRIVSFSTLRDTERDAAPTEIITTTTSPSTAAANEDAQRLLDKAAQLRAEIAQAEGKTIEEVQDEANTKKQRLQQREQKEERLRQEQRNNRKSGPNGFTAVNAVNAVQVPTTADDMVRQAARAVERAFRDGLTRQTVRFHLANVEETEREGSAITADESLWPGGARQMYRESGRPLTDALLKEIRAPSEGESNNNPPKLKRQDVLDFDGSALHTAEAAEGPSGDVQALVFPNTDKRYLDDIEKISEDMNPSRLFLLVNPFWRNADSWGFNILQPGAKKRAEKLLFSQQEDADDNAEGGTSRRPSPYAETYSMSIFSVRGEKCLAIKAYPHDWQLFAFREYDENDYYYLRNQEYAIRLGSCKEDPTSALITKLLNERPEFKETKTMRQIKKL